MNFIWQLLISLFSLLQIASTNFWIFWSISKSVYAEQDCLRFQSTCSSKLWGCEYFHLRGIHFLEQCSIVCKWTLFTIAWYTSIPVCNIFLSKPGQLTLPLSRCPRIIDKIDHDLENIYKSYKCNSYIGGKSQLLVECS